MSLPANVHLTKGPGHPQQITVNAIGGIDVIVDFAAVPQSTGTVRIVPWSQMDIRPAGIAVRAAWLPGEITAGRYFTIPSGAIRTIVGPGLASKLYLRGDVGGGTVEVEVFE